MSKLKKFFKNLNPIFICEFELTDFEYRPVRLINPNWEVAEEDGWIYFITAWQNRSLVDIIKIGSTKHKLLKRSKLRGYWVCNNRARISRYVGDYGTNEFVREVMVDQLKNGLQIKVFASRTMDLVQKEQRLDIEEHLIRSYNDMFDRKPIANKVFN